ncbi:aldo/keto reductase [Anaerolineales bacterium]
MKLKRFGSGDMQLSRLCLGTSGFGKTLNQAEAHHILDKAYEQGINCFDTADIYAEGASERILGEWIKSRKPRSIYIFTKVRGRMWDGVDGEGLSKAHLIKAVEDSLSRLQIERIDLYQSHWFDETIALEETLSAYDELLQAGKVAAIGASNHTSQQLKEALELAKQKGLPAYESLQVHYNLYHRAEFEAELEGICQQNGLGVLAYRVLGGGFAAGRNQQSGSEKAIVKQLSQDKQAENILKKVVTLAQELDISSSQLTLAWILNKGNCVPIVGVSQSEQLEALIQASQIKLNADSMEMLNMISEGI